MNLYFAPLEGITTYTYRNTHAELFGGCDEYYAPFIVPTDNERISIKTLKGILAENNTIPPKVQVMCTTPTAFCDFVKKIKSLGFNEVNLNLGCPSGTVVKKRRGSGALKDLDALDRFFDYIFSNADIKITVKSRAGFYSHDEFADILKVFNKYPIAELTLHPRVREEYYRGTPNMATFDYAYNNANMPLCCNGNLYTAKSFTGIKEKYPRLNAVMIGRGAIINPAIFREIKGGAPLKTKELLEFSYLLEQRYLYLLGSELYTLHRLKEIWLYSVQNYPDETKLVKSIKKSRTLRDLNSAIDALPEIKRAETV